jgi:hypothetical protein
MHPSDRTYRNTVIRIVDLAVTDEVIEDVQFEGCTIIGPAILGLIDNNDFISPIFDAPSLDGFFWPVAPERGPVVGVIGIRNCRFYSCRFQRVGLAAEPGFRDRILGASAGP